MALYQPTNITPSTFAGIGGGVVDVNDRISLSFQVNGNSEMTGWTATIYTNNDASTYITQFSIGRDGTPISFFGTDEHGNVNMYEYTAPTSTWSAWNLSNGNSYKMKLTLYWTENGVEKNVSTQSDSVFITRAAPTLSISPSAGTLTSVTQDFTAAYAQAQGDSVSWVRWVLTDTTSGTIIEDTGTLYTGLLAYSYNGFFSGKTYSLSCTVETSSGVTRTVTNAYAVSYSTPEQTGGITAICNADDSVTLSWMGGRYVPGLPSADDYGEILDGVLHLAASRSITWNKINGSDMSIVSPYCFAWRGKIAQIESENVTVNSGTWQPNEMQSTTGSVSSSASTSTWQKNTNLNGPFYTIVEFTLSVTTPQGGVYTGTATRAPTSGDTGIKTPVILDKGNLITATITFNGTNFVITGTAASSGSYSITYRYTRDYKGPLAYYSNIEGDLNISGATLTSITIIASDGNQPSGTVNQTISGQYQKNHYYITVYKSNNTGSVTCSFTLDYTQESILNYKSVIVGTKENASGIAISSTTADDATAEIDQNGNYIVTIINSVQTSRSAVVTFYIHSYIEMPDFLTVSDGQNNVTLNLFGLGQILEINLNGDLISAFFIPDGIWYISVYVSTNGYANVAYFNSNGEFIHSAVNAIDPDSGGLPSAITSVTISGEQECDYVYVSKDADYFANNGYTPFWNSDTLLFADFTSDLQAGPNEGVTKELSFTGTSGIYIDSRNGSTGSSNTYSSTNFIDIGNYNFLIYKRIKITGVSYVGMFFYDDSQQPVPNSGVRALYGQPANGYAYDTVSVPAGARYARFTYYTNTSTYGLFEVSGVSVSGNVAIYRNDGETLQFIGKFESGVDSIRDYGIRSGRQYVYDMYYDLEGEYSSGTESDPICRQFRQHTLIEAEEDERLANVYHPVNVWRFRDNLNAGSYTNQNQPVLLENFTAYPLWQPHSAHAKSGTLTALIGRFVNGVYSGDTAADMDRLFDLSTSVNPLFYRDMKGNLYMVRLSGPIAQTINNATGKLEVSVSVPWVEVGDATDAKIYAEA